jgi:hypothetical protein
MSHRVVAASCILAIAAAGVIGAPAAQAADVNCPTAAGSYAGGTGTSGDPFLISTPSQLQRLRDTSADWNDTVKLTADINMGGCTWGTTLGSGATTWTGTFDGDGHIVSGLDVSLVATNGGFIAYMGTGGAIRDLGFTGNVTVTATGAGSVQVSAGGLVGWTLPSTITRSFASGNVTVNVTATPSGGNAGATPIVGGLVGNLQATVTDSYATGNVSVNSTSTASGSGTASIITSVGGLAGQMDTAASIVNRAYSTGAVTSSTSATGGASQSVVERVGGSVGRFDGTYASATATVWNTVTSGRVSGIGSGSSANITGKTTAEMRTLSTFTGLGWNAAAGYDAAYVWNMCPALNGGAPALSKLTTLATCFFPPLTPAFSAPVRREDGFTISVTNYDAAWGWTPSTSAGSVTVGTAAGSTLPITVTGLMPSEFATVTLTTTRTDYATGTSSAVGQALPPPPVPASPPRSVSGVAGDGSASVSWAAPASSGSFPISHYQAVSSPGGRTCLVPAPALSCEVTGLSNGTAYTFTVSALTGAGWSAKSEPSNAVTPRAKPRPSIIITGSRDGDRIAVAGTTTGMGMGGLLTAWTSKSLADFTEGRAVMLSMDGTFTWSRQASSSVVWRVYLTADGAKSNTVTIR